MFFFNSNTLVCLSLSTGTRLRWRSIATSSPFRKKLTFSFTIPLMAGQTTWLKYYSGRLTRVALFRPKSKKMTGNSTTTFNVVNSQARKNTKCSSDLFFLKTNIDDGGPCRQSVNYFFCLQSVIFFLFCRQSEVFSPFVASRLTPFTPSCWNRFPQHKNIHFLFLPKELAAFDYHNIYYSS